MTTANNPQRQNIQAAEAKSSNRLTRWLLEPSVSVVETAERRQARLLAGFLLILGMLTIIGTVIPPVMGMVNPLEDPFSMMMGGTAILFVIAYILSRTARYIWGAVLTSLTLAALPFALSIAREDFDPTRLPSVFGWLILSLIVASIFLNVWGVAILGMLIAGGLAGFYFIVPNIEFPTLFPPLSLMIVVTFLLVVGVRQRNILERYRLADLSEKNTELQELRDTLEKRVGDRTADLQKRLVQLRTAAEISRTIAGELQQDLLLDRFVNLIKERFDLYYVGVFFVDEQTGYAVLQAGTGQSGARMLAEDHRLVVGGSSMIGWATAHREPRIALDVGQEAVHFNNPHLPLTRSEMALPLSSGDQVLGALTIQSIEPEAFDEDDITILQGIADSMATAIINARLFNQVNETLQEIETLQRNYISDAWSEITPSVREFSLTKDLEDTNGIEQDLDSFNIPLMLRDQVIGNLLLETDKSSWTSEETAFIEAITNQATIALENARLLEETRLRAERERVISDVANKFWSSTDVDTILRTSVQELGRILNASESIIQLDISDDNPGQ